MIKKERNDIISHIRLSFRRSQVIKEAMRLSVHPTIKGVRGGKRYTCNHCKEAFLEKDIQVDHIDKVIPIGSSINDMTFDDFINRLFCTVEELQILCKPCHLIKTKEEKNYSKLSYS